MALEILQAQRPEFAELLALNLSCVPHVNAITEEAMQYFRDATPHFLTVREAGKLAGFVIALPPGLGYQSPNYQWFCNHYSRFLYIDRIMVHPDFRRRGVASLLYRELERIALAENYGRLTCEVNLSPPNPDSLELHLKLGFTQQQMQHTDGGLKEVSLLAKELVFAIA